MLMGNNFCIPKNVVDGFIQRLKSGEISPEKMTEMTSAERNKYLSGFLGKTNASRANALFESKLLLKNQQLGIINWAKQLSGIKPVAKRDLISRVEKMTEILQPKEADRFYSDLARQRLGVEVTIEEAGKIADLAKTVGEKKALIKEDMQDGSQERMEYGESLVLFQDYVKNLKLEARQHDVSVKEFLTSPYEWGRGILKVAGSLKSMKASFDASVLGRQGFVTLVTKPKIWANAATKMVGDWKTSFKGLDATLPIKADIFSRSNALNGNYKKMGIDIGIDSEEAFPAMWGEKIPIIGKGYKASREAFEGAMLRMRADWADAMVKEYEKQGVDIADSGMGRVINSLTGRGNLGLPPGMSKAGNILFFSVKYVKGQFDILTAHMFDEKVRQDPVAFKTAYTNLVRVMGVIAGSMFIAKGLDPESVDLDPRSSKFGKIWLSDDRDVKLKDRKLSIDITGGLGSMITFLSRAVIPTTHKGKLGLWYKTNNGKFVNLVGGDKWAMDWTDVISQYIGGKLSPASRIFKDVITQKTFVGDKPTVKGELKEIVTPISGSNAMQMLKTDKTGNMFLKILLAGAAMLGMGTKESKPRKLR